MKEEHQNLSGHLASAISSTASMPDLVVPDTELACSIRLLQKLFCWHLPWSLTSIV